MALIAIIMCTFTISCSKEETYSEKKLVKFGNESQTYTFSYDRNGKLTKASEVRKDSNGTYYYDYQYTWSDGSIKVDYKYKQSSEETYDSNYSYSLLLENGVIKKKSNVYNEYTTTISYNQSLKFSKSERVRTDGNILTYTAEWDGDKMVCMNKNWWNTRIDISTYYYEGESCSKGYSPLIPNDMLQDIIFIAHPEIGGMRTNQLPSTRFLHQGPPDSDKTKGETSTYSYEFDEDGYLTQIKIDDREIYTCTWE